LGSSFFTPEKEFVMGKLVSWGRGLLGSMALAFVCLLVSVPAFADIATDIGDLTATVTAVGVAVGALAAAILVIWGIVVGIRNARAAKGFS
jgi:hypothetical protein